MDFNPLKIRLIVGLGNPGKAYLHTYHNVGFLFIEHLLNKSSQKKMISKKNFEFAKLSIPPIAEQQIVVKPKTFMNVSGSAVLSAMKAFNVTESETLIVHDDADIEIGKYKISYGKNSAGHHGIDSIIHSLRTKNFWRLRIGIRPKILRNQTHIKHRKAGKFVLKKISTPYKLVIEKMFSEIQKSPTKLKGPSGFTLFELLIYISIFAIIMTAFIAVFLNVLRIQNHQAATTEVSTEIQFAMQKIQQLVRASGAIEASLTSSSTLKLCSSTGSCASDNIILSGGKILAGNTPNEKEITGSKVFVDSLVFEIYSLPEASDTLLVGNVNRKTVSVEILMSYLDGKTNPQKKFSQTLRFSASPLLYQ